MEANARIPFLCKISLRGEVSKASDAGKPFVLTDSFSTKEFNKLLQKIGLSVN